MWRSQGSEETLSEFMELRPFANQASGEFGDDVKCILTLLR